jgi:hypothetical protein
MYSRTQNDNGTYNTRCLFCFMTIASSVESAGELDRLEHRHICPERALSELLEQEKAQEKAIETRARYG